LREAGRIWNGWAEIFSRPIKQRLHEHEQKLLKGIGKCSRRDTNVLFNGGVVARRRNLQRFSGDHYVSGFLDPLFLPARRREPSYRSVSEAIEVLRISALSTYKTAEHLGRAHCCSDSAGCLATELPSQPPELALSSELTSIRSFIESAMNCAR